MFVRRILGSTRWCWRIVPPRWRGGSTSRSSSMVTSLVTSWFVYPQWKSHQMFCVENSGCATVNNPATNLKRFRFPGTENTYFCSFNLSQSSLRPPSWKAQSAAIGQHTQAWASTSLCFQSAMLLFSHQYHPKKRFSTKNITTLLERKMIRPLYGVSKVIARC